MLWKPIQKQPESWAAVPNLLNYDDTVSSFSWDDIRGALSGLPEKHGLNIAYEAVDRHADGPLRDHVAIRWLGTGGTGTSDP